MREYLPQLSVWNCAAQLYPSGNWLVDPHEYKDYIFELAGKIQAPDLQAVDNETSIERLRNWTKCGVIEPIDNMEFMTQHSQELPRPIYTQSGKLGGLDICIAHTQGYRSHYQDRTSFISIPMDRSGSWAYLTALFDGHGPDKGGEQVAQMLSDAEGVQVLIKSMHEWSERLSKPWMRMVDAEIENGWHFIVLQLQHLISQHLVSNLHQSHIALQARSLALTLQQTLKSMAMLGEPGAERLEQSIKGLDDLKSLLDGFHSLEGVGSTAVYALWQVDATNDCIHLWVINVGDSSAGLVTTHGPHYSLAEEASVSNPIFQEDILLRGGKIEYDEYGIARLNGQYSLCRSLGDLFVIREWTEVKACVQMMGMSPRPTVSKVTLCQNPQLPGEISFNQALAFVQHCDGMKEENTLTSAQIFSFISHTMKTEQDLGQAIERLVARAVGGGSHDNCTLQVVDLRALAQPAFRKKFYRYAKPSLVFQPSTFFQGFI